MQISDIDGIFNSVEKNGLKVGVLSTCIRTFSCNLDCKFCDAPYCVKPKTDEDLKGYHVFSTNEILDDVAEYGNQHVSILGGEPALQKDLPELISSLLDLEYEVSVHVQGASDLTSIQENVTELISNQINGNKLHYVLDYKCPNSNEDKNMLSSNIVFLTENDSLIFRVSTTEDLDYVKDLLMEYEPECYIYLTPVEVEGKTLTVEEIRKYMYEKFIDIFTDSGNGNSNLKIRIQTELI